MPTQEAERAQMNDRWTLILFPPDGETEQAQGSPSLKASAVPRGCDGAPVAPTPLQGKEGASGRPANTHPSVRGLTSAAPPSSGKYLTLCGKARERESSEGLWKAVKYGYWFPRDARAGVKRYPQPGGEHIGSQCRALAPRATDGSPVGLLTGVI